MHTCTQMVDGWTDRDGWMNGQMDRWTDELTERQMDVDIYDSIFPFFLVMPCSL